MGKSKVGLAVTGNRWGRDGHLDDYSEGDGISADNGYNRVYIDIVESNYSLGLAFNASYYLNKSLYFGANYRPTMMKFSSETKFGSNHYLSFGFGLNIWSSKNKN